MNKQLLPFGYAAYQDTQSLQTLMGEERTLLIDVRFVLFSRRFPQWSQDALRTLFGNRYRWAGKCLGNVNYRGGPITLANPVVGLQGLTRYLAEGYRLILLCACREYEGCHRQTIVKLVRAHIPEVEVMFPEVVPPANTVYCLSLRQPYAQWLLHPECLVQAGIPAKTIENRDWTTTYRGPLLIHASKTFEGEALDDWSGVFLTLSSVIPCEQEQYPRGAILGMATLTDIITDSDDPWFVGSYGFVLHNARAFSDPIPYRGQLKLFPVPRSLLPEA